MVVIKAQALKDFVADIFLAEGCSAAESGRIGHYLVEANLTGHDSHGVVRVPRYVQMRRDGLVIADQTPEILHDTPVMATVDGRFGFGQTMAPIAVRLGIEKCRGLGLCAIALRNAGHIGRVGDWAEMAAQAGLISVHFVNASGSVLVAPFGGVDRRFSTAPYVVGVPRQGQPPLILDFATSVVAEGKVLVASQGGKKLPADALITPDGVLTGDPHALYGAYEPSGPRNYRQGTGAIRAMGEHKGSGLAFMCELLGGALTGNTATQENRNFSNGMLSIYIDPHRIDPEGLFPPEMARYTSYVKASKPATPGREVLVPGEPEIAMRAERTQQGVPLPDDIWSALAATAQAVGLTKERLQAARA